MDTAEIRLLLDLVAIVFAVSSFIYAHVRTKDAARQNQLSDLERRVTKAESKLEETPTSKALHELAISMERQNGQMSALFERLNSLSGIVERLEKVTVRQDEFLRKVGAKQ